jgi:hypothetical protein
MNNREMFDYAEQELVIRPGGEFKPATSTQQDKIISYDQTISYDTSIGPTQKANIKGDDPISYYKRTFGGRADRIGGALAYVIRKFVELGVNAVALDDSASLVLKSGGPSRHSYMSVPDFLLDLRVAIQNHANKIVETIEAEDGFDSELDLLGRTVGIWFNIANSQLYADYRPYELILESPDTSDILVYQVFPKKPQQEFLIMFPANNGGLGLLQSLSEINATIPVDELIEGTVISAQTINARDVT